MYFLWVLASWPELSKRGMFWTNGGQVSHENILTDSSAIRTGRTAASEPIMAPPPLAKLEMNYLEIR